MACDPDIAIPPGARRRVARIMSGCGERGAGAAGSTAKGGVYHQRKPRASPLYQCADRHLAELRSEGRLQRLLEERVIERFLKCGDPHHGFAAFQEDRKSTRLNSSHLVISYAVFCLKKKK